MVISCWFVVCLVIVADCLFVCCWLLFVAFVIVVAVFVCCYGCLLITITMTTTMVIMVVFVHNTQQLLPMLD